MAQVGKELSKIMGPQPSRKPVVESKQGGIGVSVGKGLEEVLKAPIGSKLKSYDKDAQSMQEGAGWTDKQDATRDLIGVGNTARIAGKPVAKFLAKAYEMLSGSATGDDAKMDEHNNKLALSLFNAKSYEEVKERVSKLMETAQFQDFTDPDKPVFMTGLDTTKPTE